MPSPDAHQSPFAVRPSTIDQLSSDLEPSPLSLSPSPLSHDNSSTLEPDNVAGDLDHPSSPDMNGFSNSLPRPRGSPSNMRRGLKHSIGSNRSRRTKHDDSISYDDDDDEGHKDSNRLLSGDRDMNFSTPSTSEDVELDRLQSDDDLTDDEEAGLTKRNKRRRRRRKRKNTLLDERIVGNSMCDEQNLANKSVIKTSLVNALLIGLWYLFSLSISIYNKWMFSPDHLNFDFPLFTTCGHMLVQFCLASIVLYLVPRFRPRADSISNPQNYVQTAPGSTQSSKSLMTRMFYVTRIGPCGAATGLDIGLGNMSLKFISLTFFTMCKSSALAFVLLFAFLFRLETPSIKLILIIATMTIGVVMMVAGETAFNALGFILIISSAFFSGFRWALTQILLLRNPATSNPFSSISFLAPVMFVSLLLIAMPVEGPRKLFEGLGVLMGEKGAFQGVGLLLFPGVIAFLMTASEFALLQRTSVVTLSICGIFKEVVTISAAGIVFHDDTLTPINVSGLLVTIASIAAYNYIKITKMKKEAMVEVENSVNVTRRYDPTITGENDVEGRRINDDERIGQNIITANSQA